MSYEFYNTLIISSLQKQNFRLFKRTYLGMFFKQQN